MRSIRRSGARRLATLLLATLLALTLAAPALAEQTATDTQQLRASVIEQAGTERGVSPDIAITGPTATFSRSVVNQVDVQVDASVPGSGPVSQTETNDATVDQTTTATAGATSTDGGIARSGRAIAGTIAIIQQINIQIVAGWVPAGGVSQTASNTANVGQTTDAISGGATAGTDAAATSGDAGAISRVVVVQRNIQIFRGTDPDATGAIAQAVANTADVLQDTRAQTGEALADARSQASTGASDAVSSGRLTQENGTTVAQW